MRAGTVLKFALIFLVADVAMNRFAFSDGWTIIWPLNGVNVALLLMRPRSQWLWMVIGIELGTGIGEFLDNNPLGFVIFQRCCSAAEILICAMVLRPVDTLESWLRSRDFHTRLLGALSAGPGISGLIAASYVHLFRSEPFLSSFNGWATADALGIAVTLPLALSFTAPRMRALFMPRQLLRTMGVLTLAVAVAVLVFSVSQYPLIFLLYPLLVFVDYALGFAGAAVVMVLSCLVAVYCTTNGYGPFGTWSDRLALPRDLALQIYIGFHAIALFPASVMLMERRRLAAELKASNARLSVLASLDGLTGIANRRSFDEHFEEEWARAVRAGSSISLGMIDIDNFKQFNDLYGHAAGDRCLREVAQSLQRSLQRPEDLMARFGGEEFAFVLPGASREGTSTVAERLRAVVYDLSISHLGNPWNKVTISIGYATAHPVEGDASTSLIQLADAALYQAKREGRNRIETIASIEGLDAANDHMGNTTKIRLLRLIGFDHR